MTIKLPRITGVKAVQALRRAGWYEHHRRGSHIYLRHAEQPGKQITLPVHRGKDLLPKVLSSILRQAGITKEDFDKLL